MQPDFLGSIPCHASLSRAKLLRNHADKFFFDPQAMYVETIGWQNSARQRERALTKIPVGVDHGPEAWSREMLEGVHFISREQQSD